jgi:VIT1/CCC1 family predicted Fe2+/Mn2+ transporter
MAVVYSLEMDMQTVFIYSMVFTAVSFFSIGLLKGKVVGRPPLRSGLSTLAIGKQSAVAVFFLVCGLLSEHLK